MPPTSADPEARPVPLTAFEKRFGHPLGLVVLFFTEMWERFSYYGMRGLLKLYMANYLFVTAREALQGCRGLTPPCALVPGDPNTVLFWSSLKPSLPTNPAEAASILYGAYTGLVYFTPFIGGLLADRVLGQRKTVVIGALLMAAGHFVMAIENAFFLALGLLILGNGAFKPNVSTQVGSLYRPGDPRRGARQLEGQLTAERRRDRQTTARAARGRASPRPRPAGGPDNRSRSAAAQAPPSDRAPRRAATYG